jgi:hypothetical protein
MVAFIALLWRRPPARLVELSVVIGAMVIGNGFLTGSMSMPDDRYECRVIWLVPLLAGLFVSAWLCRWQTDKTADLSSGGIGSPLPMKHTIPGILGRWPRRGKRGNSRDSAGRLL